MYGPRSPGASYNRKLQNIWYFIDWYTAKIEKKIKKLKRCFVGKQYYAHNLNK